MRYRRLPRRGRWVGIWLLCVCVCVWVVCVVCAFFLCVGVVCGVFLLGGGKAVVGDGSPWESLLVCAR